MSTDRYRAIMALLDDPLNQACFLREYRRREMSLLQLLPPPFQVGEKWVFPSLEFAMRRRVPNLPLLAKNPTLDTIDTLYEVFEGDEGWMVLNVPDDAEFGPFPTEQDALHEAKEIALQEGMVVLNRLPWDNEDIANWILK